MMQQTRAKNTFHYHFTLWCFFKISNRPYASHSLSFPTAICLAVRCSFLPTLFLISGQSGASLAYSRIIASSSCDHRPRPVFGASTPHRPHAPAPFSDSLELSSAALLAGVGVGLSAWCSFSSSSSTTRMTMTTRQSQRRVWAATTMTRKRRSRRQGWRAATPRASPSAASAAPPAGPSWPSARASARGARSARWR